MAMPHDAERVMQLRSMLREARKEKLLASLEAEMGEELGGRRHPGTPSRSGRPGIWL
jgi:hypothetical protein